MLQDSNVEKLFKARSIAIVGVSSETSKIGSVIFRNLVEGGYTGEIYLINPKYKTLYERPCYASLTAVPGEIDCACIAIPADFVKNVMKEAAQKKVASVVIISAGFGEKGKEGKALEAELVQIASAAGIRILGPNCLGFMNLNDNINLSFAATSPEKGDIALISQSGAICTAILDIAEKDDLGFSYAVSVGNKSDLSENSLVHYLLDDTSTKVIGAYLEDIEQGRALVDLYNAAGNSKPLIVIKPGISEAGQKAISSHTGAAISSNSAQATAFEQRGIVHAESLEEFYLLLQCFSLCNPMLNDTVAIATNAGGPGILATDAVVAAKLTLAAINPELAASLRVVLPTESSVQNPIDMLGDAKADRFQQTLEVLTKDSTLGAILVIITPQYVTQIEETCQQITAISKTARQTIIPILLGNFIVEKGKNILRKAHVPYATEIKNAVSVLAKMAQFEKKKLEIAQHPDAMMTIAVNVAPHSTILQKTAATIQLLESYSVTQVEQTLAPDLQAALNWATIHYPVVLKVPTEISAHKTEVQGVLLGIKNDKDLKEAWQKLKHNIPGEYSILVQQMLSYEEEFFIGATRDPSFGQVMVFGKGGVYTTEYNDYGRILLPASRQEILSALSTTIISKILVGARGKKPLPVDALIKTIESFQQLLLEHPEIKDIDCNPLLITKTSVHAVDVKVYIDA